MAENDPEGGGGGGGSSNRDSEESNRVGVGVAVFVLKKSESGEPLILLGKRRSSVGHSTFALPGGHLEFGETWEECAAREVREETGLSLTNVEFATAINSIMLQDEVKLVHYVCILMRAQLSDPLQEPQTLEPHKCFGWDWYSWSALPSPLFSPLQSLLNSGYTPF